MRQHRTGLFLLVILLILPVVNCAGTQAARPEEASLKIFLQKYDKEEGPGRDASYYSAFVDLDDDGKPEALAYLSGWCGSGGCTLLVLKPEGSSYRVVTDMSIARLPISVLPSKTNGWRDLSVRVQGGGILQGYDAVLKFNGKTYPSNATTPPAIRATETLPTTTLIADPPKEKRFYK